MFGGLALLLATVGLYGVVAGIVAQRTPEIGMRMALGASRRDVVTLILKQGFAMTGIGIAIGLAGALVVARLFKGLLLNVSATDGVSFAGDDRAARARCVGGDVSAGTPRRIHRSVDRASKRMTPRKRTVAAAAAVAPRGHRRGALACAAVPAA